MQINRLFEIIYILLDKKTVTANELAKKFEVSSRTIYRDVEILSGAGIPIYTTKGKGGGISILDNFILDKSVISKEEQSAIITALTAMSVLPNVEKTGIADKMSLLFKSNDSSWIDVDFSDWNVEQKNFFDKVNIPRHSRGLFINGHSPTLLATRESALVRLPLAKGSLLAASKLGFIS